MKNSKAKLIVICGPTASGKTKISLRLAKVFSGEIIAADSRTIYKGMDIGTAKPTLEEKKGTPHYMIDIVRPDQEFTMAQFKQKAVKIIRDIQKRGKIPFLVGGTGLYISSIVDNLQIPRVPPNKKLRKKLEKQIAKYGLNKLWKKLIKLDPEAKKFVQKENPRRVIRALEVIYKTKKPFSQLRQKGQPLFNVLQIGVKMPQEKLEQRINQRVDLMIKQGLVKEIEKLLKKYSPDLPAMSGIGYHEIIKYLQGQISLEEAIKLIKQDTRRYARRQMTWFKRDKRIKWVKNYREAFSLITLQSFAG
jgi:tRNA dimethylallyltransferase